MERPLISVIVPVYNIIDLLPKCVESIKNQTYRNIEILLVDDGSTDGTGALCDTLKESDARIRVFHKENGGSSSARNLGISNAKGQFLGFVDSDDFIEPDMYERMLNVLLEHNGLVAQIGRDEIDATGAVLADVCTPPEELFFCKSEDFLKELLLHKGDCSFCTKLVAKELFLKRQFPLGILNEDFYLLVNMLLEIEGIYSLPGYGYHVFYRIGSNTRKADKEEFPRVYGDCVENADRVFELVQEKYPKLTKVAIRFGLFQRLEYLLHIPLRMMNRRNTQYKQCVSCIRKHIGTVFTSKYLTKKNKLYLILFSIAPKSIKRVHRISMRKRGLA